jgi:hypothetical protein
VSEDEYDGEGAFITRPALCKQCGREIGFRDKKPYDVRFVSDGVYRLTNAPHNQTCPVRVKQRIHDHCMWCKFIDDGDSILNVRALFGYETCEKHSDKNAEFQYHGKTYKYIPESLYAIYREAIRENKRRAKRAEKPRGNDDLSVFLS